MNNAVRVMVTLQQQKEAEEGASSSNPAAMKEYFKKRRDSLLSSDGSTTQMVGDRQELSGTIRITAKTMWNGLIAASAKL